MSSALSSKKAMAPSQLHRIDWLAEQYVKNPKLIFASTSTWLQWDRAWEDSPPSTKAKYLEMSQITHRIAQHRKDLQKTTASLLPIHDTSQESLDVIAPAVVDGRCSDISRAMCHHSSFFGVIAPTFIEHDAAPAALTGNVQAFDPSILSSLVLLMKA